MPQTFGVIAPHPPIMVEAVGGARASVTEASIESLHRVAEAVATFSPDVIVLTSPHAPAVFDAFAIDTSEGLSGSFAQFGAAQAAFRCAGHPELAHAIIGQLSERDIPAIERSSDARLGAGELDHGVLVPLSFIDPMCTRPIVVISYSGLKSDCYRALGASIREAAERLGLKVAFVASGDLSHRLTPDAPAGFSPRAAELDERIVSLIRDGRFGELADIPDDLVSAGGECGLRSFMTMGGFAGPDPVPTHVLAYEGPWGVGYLTALVGAGALSFDADASTPNSGDKGGMPGQDASDIVRLARAAIEAHVAHRDAPVPQLTDKELPDRAGAFVSLHRKGSLRGCIGTVLPTRDTLADEVVANAIQAATRDPRFPPVQPGELADLDVKVDVLHAPEACTVEDLDPDNYGIIVSSGWRRGLLLPDLDGVDDVAEQVGIAMRKGGILPHEPCRFERFKVDRYT